MTTPDLGSYSGPPPRAGKPWWFWLLLGCGVTVVLVIAGVAVLGAILFPVFQQGRAAGRAAACASNGMRIGRCLGHSHAGERPAAATRKQWEDAALAFTPQNPRLFVCPADEAVRNAAGRESSYAFNSLQSGANLARIARPAQVVLAFDSDAHRWNAADRAASFSRRATGGGEAAQSGRWSLAMGTWSSWRPRPGGQARVTSKLNRKKGSGRAPREPGGGGLDDRRLAGGVGARPGGLEPGGGERGGRGGLPASGGSGHAQPGDQMGRAARIRERAGRAGALLREAGVVPRARAGTIPDPAARFSMNTERRSPSARSTSAATT